MRKDLKYMKEKLEILGEIDRFCTWPLLPQDVFCAFSCYADNNCTVRSACSFVFLALQNRDAERLRKRVNHDAIFSSSDLACDTSYLP